MPATYLLTGVAGFIGSHLAGAITAGGDRVVGVDNFDPFYSAERKRRNLQGLPPDRFTLVEADIRDDSLIEVVAETRPDVIVHLAALAGVRPSIEAPVRYMSVNVAGLGNVLEAARQCGCGRLVFASSSSVYGNNEKVPFAETDPVGQPISPYAASKRAGELLCGTSVHLFGLSIAVVRLFTVFGPAQRPDLAIAKFMDLIAAGREVPMYGDGSSSRDYTYVDDIVRGIEAACGWTDRHPGVLRIFNLGGSHPVSLRDLIDRVAAVVGRPARISPRPAQAGDVQRTWADLTRSRHELGFQPEVSLEEGLVRQWERDPEA
jgi:UDP-glucuronate 4-epimerase